MKTKFWSGIFTNEQTKNLMDPDDVSDIIVENLHPIKKIRKAFRNRTFYYGMRLMLQD
jgi:hypothetical protein